MKKYNYLIVSLLALNLLSCGKKDILFSIDSNQLKSIYKPSETAKLKIENPENIKIDSVIYFGNDKKIGISKENSNLNLNLNQYGFGLQNIKAIVYFEGVNSECFTSFEIVSPIKPTIKEYNIINTYLHDKKAYTQGLEFYNGTLLEGTGQNGESTLRKTDAKSGKISQTVSLNKEFFGEGITVFNNKIYQLTWQNNKGFIYNASTLEKIKDFDYFKTMEGWGLTHNRDHLIMSDGTNTIYFLDPETQKLVRSINVYSDSNKVDQLNELEWIEGKIWANVYQKDIIVIINPENGAIESVIDFSELKTKITQEPDTDVLNGIAYNPNTKTVFITGKNWDKMFEIKLK